MANTDLLGRLVPGDVRSSVERTTLKWLASLQNNPRRAALTGLVLFVIVNRYDAYQAKRRRALHRRQQAQAAAAHGHGHAHRKKLSPQEEKLEEERQRKRIVMDGQFLVQLRGILPIVLPGLRSKEFLILFLHTLFLFARTFVSIWVAMLDGTIVKSIVDKDLLSFIWNLFRWLLTAIPATYCNSMIRFLESKLAIGFRTRLTQHLYALYMSNECYYRVENLDSRLTNPDQNLTQDVANFCDALAHIHSQVSKPVLDVVLMTLQLIWLNKDRAVKAGARADAGSSWFGIWFSVTIVWITGRLLKALSPPFGKLISTQAHLEGALRAAHSRLITNSEEIAFYGGHKVEQAFLMDCYTSLVKHMNGLFRVRIFYNMLEGFLMKYVWSATGLLMIAVPVFAQVQQASANGQPLSAAVIAGAASAARSDDAQSVADRTEGFITARGLLVSLADACERIMSSFKEISALAGYTNRVSEMLTVFQNMGQQRYVKKLATTADRELMQSRGRVTESDSTIEFKSVPLVTPNGDMLVQSLNLRLESGMHLLICGPNGCGKSSLFRILSGLWPVYAGDLTKPTHDNLFYIPQKPYLCHGSLRDQVIYPHSHRDMLDKGLTDFDLDALMGQVDLNKIVERSGGWDAVFDWADVLSGGEKQRVAMARLFYHRPKFAILDECTSAVSEDVEGKMYAHAKELGITLMTVSHRHTLWKYHNHLLQFDGLGGWKFAELDANARLSLKEEKAKIEHELRDIPKKQERLRELCVFLGEDSKVLDEEKKFFQELQGARSKSAWVDTDGDVSAEATEDELSAARLRQAAGADSETDGAYTENE